MQHLKDKQFPKQVATALYNLFLEFPLRAITICKLTQQNRPTRNRMLVCTHEVRSAVPRREYISFDRCDGMIDDGRTLCASFDAKEAIDQALSNV